MNGLLGRVRLRPGQADAVQLQGSSGWLGRLAQGRAADDLPALMASVHTLCSHGHALASRLALRAAQGVPAVPSGAERTSLAVAVARDHLLRLAHDWPRLLPRGGGAPLSLQHCPLWHRHGCGDAERLTALAPWLQHWLGLPVPALLADLLADPMDASLHWAAKTDTPLARLMSRELPPALALPTPHRPLTAASIGGTPHHPLAAASTSATRHRPLSATSLLQGATPHQAVPDTGPWTRTHDSRPAPAHNAGMRLIARLVDLLRLAAPRGADWLLAEGHALGHGRGLAVVEVGRGLLCYEVSLVEQLGRATVQSLQVISPSDWNLHPAGVLAEALRSIDDAASATRLAVAFDPCVPFDIEMPEALHA